MKDLKLNFNVKTINPTLAVIVIEDTNIIIW